MKNDTKQERRVGEKGEEEEEEGDVPSGCCLVTPKQVAARGGRTKSCMSSRVVVVSIKPIIIANSYASLSTFSTARVGWQYQGQGRGQQTGGRGE